MVPLSGEQVLYFTILNAAATQLPQLHQLSDAGAGANLMHLTPTRDSEIISGGFAATPLPGAGPPTGLPAQGLLTNGGISPAVLTHGLLRLLAGLGYRVVFRSYNFGVPAPDVPPCDWWHECQHFGGEEADTDALIQDQLLPDLIRQAETGMNLVAECGVGGTTFSTLWLRLLTGLPLSPAGSTRDAEKLAAKSRLLTAIEAEYGQHDFQIDRLLAHPGFHDPIQRTMYRVITQWPQGLAKPWLAGGMMFVAPLMAALRSGSEAAGHRVATTRWVMEGEGAQVLPFLPDDVTLDLHRTDFTLARLSCLNRYEQGQVVEGCGLGGCLVLLEQLGITSTQIIAALEQASDDHIERITRQNFTRAIDG